MPFPALEVGPIFVAVEPRSFAALEALPAPLQRRENGGNIISLLSAARNDLLELVESGPGSARPFSIHRIASVKMKLSF